MPTPEEILAALRRVGPFEIVTGDAIHRTNPSSRQQVNTAQAWIVGDGFRSRMSLQSAVEILNAAIRE